jgi:hypothetical protein
MKTILLSVTIIIILLAGCSMQPDADFANPAAPTVNQSSWGAKNDTTAPIAPVISDMVTGVNEESIIISWTSGNGSSDNVADFMGFSVYRSNTGDLGFSLLNNALITKNDKITIGNASYYYYEDPGLDTNSSYLVVAKDYGGNASTNVALTDMTTNTFGTGSISGFTVDNRGDIVGNALIIAFYSRNNKFSTSTYSKKTFSEPTGAFKIENLTNSFPEKYTLYAETADGKSGNFSVTFDGVITDFTGVKLTVR